MKKLIFIFLIACGALNAQTAYPYVQRNQLLTPGRVPFVTTNGIVTDISTFGFNSGTGVLSTPVLSVSGISGLGISTSSTTNLNLAAGTTGVSSLRMPHGVAPTSPVNGDMWSTTAGFFGRVNGATVGPFGVGGSGTVTVVGAGSLTSTALVTGGGSQTLQTPSATATMDSSGNISTPGTLTVGNAATTAGAIALTQGTTQSTGTTNITVQAPTGVTSYIATLPGTVGTNGAFWTQTTSGSTATLINTKVVPTGTVVGTSDTQTLTNKRVSARVLTVTSSATPTANTDNADVIYITALATTVTSMTTNLTGTPVAFDQLEYWIVDNGTARGITWGASFVAGPVALPTTTIISKPLHVYFERNPGNTAWVCMAFSNDL